MNTDNILLDVKKLVVQYETDDSVVHAVNDVSFTIQKGETLGLSEGYLSRSTSRSWSILFSISSLYTIVYS